MKIFRRTISLLVAVFCFQMLWSHPIKDYYKAHKHDQKMEARVVPPKMAAILVREDYPKAVDVLKSLSALRYMAYNGKQKQVADYAKQAIAAKGNYKTLLVDESKDRSISVFGIKKNGLVRKLMAVVQTKDQFVLLIAKGKLTERQLKILPDLSKEL